MPHVLVVGMSRFAKLGLRDSLTSGDSSIVVQDVEPDQVVAVIQHAPPDAVVLDLDAANTAEFAADLVRRFPSLTVVACSMIDPRMRVFPASQRGEFYDATLTLQGLAAALTTKN